MATTELTADGIYNSRVAEQFVKLPQDQPYALPPITLDKSSPDAPAIPSPITSGEISKPEFWQKLSADAAYGKDFFDKIPASDKVAGYVDFTYGGNNPTDILTTVRLLPDGTTRSVQQTKADYDAAQKTNPVPLRADLEKRLKAQENATAEAAKMIFGPGGIGLLEADAKAANAAALVAVSAVADKNAAIGQINVDLFKGLSGLMNDLQAAGEAKSVRAGQRIQALADPEVQKLARDLLVSGMERQKKLHAEETIAQQRLLDMQNNPLQQAASVLYGGPEKNPYLKAAGETVTTLANARTTVQQQVNSALEGVIRMQAASEKQFLVETPAEVRAQTAEDIQKVRTAGAALARANAGLPADSAETYAKALEMNFKTTAAVLEKKIAGNNALLAGASKEVNAAIQLETAAMRKQIADQADETKRYGMDLKAAATQVGLDPSRAPEIARIYWQVKNFSTELPDAKSATQHFNDGLKRNDPVLQAIRVLEEGKTASPAENWKIVSDVFQKFPRLAEFYPGLQVATKPGENGYDRWLGIVNGVDSAKAAILGPNGNPKLKDEKELARQADQAYFKAVMGVGIQKPEAPLTIKYDGKEIPLRSAQGGTVVSPYIVRPGRYLAMNGEQNVTALPEILKRAIDPAVNQVAAMVAKAENSYVLAPKSSGSAKKTIGPEEIIGAALEVRKTDPTLTLDQAAQQISAIYQAGIWLNNLQAGYEKFGLPKQQDYVVDFESRGILASIWNTSAYNLASNESPRQPTTTSSIENFLGTYDAAGNKFRLNYDISAGSAFANIPASVMKVDMSTPAKVRNLLLTSTSADFWGLGK